MNILKYFLLLIILLVSCFNVAAQSRAQELGYELLYSLYIINPEKLTNTLKTAMKEFRDDHKAFTEFLNTRNNCGFTALMHTVMYGDIGYMDRILETMRTVYGTDVQEIYNVLNATDSRNRNVLMLAAMFSNNQSFTTFITNGLSLLQSNKQLYFKTVNMQDQQFGMTSLDYAIIHSSYQNVNALVTQVKNVLGEDSSEFNNFLNIPDKYGILALSYVAYIQTKSLLTKLGAKESTRVNPQVFQILQFGYQLSNAIIDKNIDEATKLIKRIKDVKIMRLRLGSLLIRRIDGNNLLFHALEIDNDDFFQFILTSAEKMFIADPELIFWILNSVDINGFNPLNYALSRRKFNKIKLLLDAAYRHANIRESYFQFINCPDNLLGFTPLINAGYKTGGLESDAYYETIKYMIDQAKYIFGHDTRPFYLFINAKDDQGNNVLNYINKRDTPNLYKLLSDELNHVEYVNTHRIEPRLIDNLDPRIQKLRTALINLVKNNKATNKQLQDIIDQVKSILKNNKEGFLNFINTADSQGKTALIRLIENNKKTELEYFLRKVSGYLDNPKLIFRFMTESDNENGTPLYYAVIQNRPELVKFILDYADRMFGRERELFLEFLNAEQIVTRKTALMQASQLLDTTILKLLLDKAFKVFGRNSAEYLDFIDYYNIQHETAYHFSYYDDGANMLRKYGAKPVERQEKIFVEVQP